MDKSKLNRPVSRDLMRVLNEDLTFDPIKDQQRNDHVTEFNCKQNQSILHQQSPQPGHNRVLESQQDFDHWSRVNLAEAIFTSHQVDHTIRRHAWTSGVSRINRQWVEADNDGNGKVRRLDLVSTPLTNFLMENSKSGNRRASIIDGDDVEILQELGQGLQRSPSQGNTDLLTCSKFRSSGSISLLFSEESQRHSDYLGSEYYYWNKIVEKSHSPHGSQKVGQEWPQVIHQKATDCQFDTDSLSRGGQRAVDAGECAVTQQLLLNDTHHKTDDVRERKVQFFVGEQSWTNSDTPGVSSESALFPLETCLLLVHSYFQVPVRPKLFDFLLVVTCQIKMCLLLRRSALLLPKSRTRSDLNLTSSPIKKSTSSPIQKSTSFNQFTHSEINQFAHSEINQFAHSEINQFAHSEINQFTHSEINQFAHSEINQFQPVPPFRNQPVPPFRNQPVPPFRNQPVRPFRNQPVPPFRNQPVRPFRNQPVPTSSPIQKSTSSPIQKSTSSNQFLHSEINQFQPVPPFRNQRSPIQKSTSFPIQKSTSSPIQKSTSSPIQKSTSSPIQKSTSSPIQKSTSSNQFPHSEINQFQPVPPFRNQPVPPFRNQPVRPFRNQPVPPFRNQPVPPFRNQSVPPFRINQFPHSEINQFPHSEINQFEKKSEYPLFNILNSFVK
ncbi:hypothetical protein Btru_025884 [Bulinus truncatus]|nr:hypothetical protein Btru_025884 [Bulinus truncatus]